MRQAIWIAVLVGAGFVLGGCAETKSVLGLNKSIPDEFAVYSRAPLSLPPDYGLRPPEPGTNRPQRVMPSDQARQALSGKKNPSAPAKQVAAAGGGVQALLKEAGAQQTDPEIRLLINRESSNLAEEGKNFTDAILFWKDAKPAGLVVDPTKEAKRIQDAKAMGTPLNEGEVPTISREKGNNLFKDIF
ncbi:MAG: DUF3035 domain-containing protein [Rhodospirillales bacterium]|nr:DUF3035 domain-containing protein [Rhodospirillales bacterium]